jgi:hypothetical protein
MIKDIGHIMTWDCELEGNICEVILYPSIRLMQPRGIRVVISRLSECRSHFIAYT